MHTTINKNVDEGAPPTIEPLSLVCLYINYIPIIWSLYKIV